MFLAAPLVTAVLSFAGIILIVSRKFVYLKRISPEVVRDSYADRGFFYTFFQEIIDGFKKVNIRAQLVHLLHEFERSLRTIRIFAMRIDSGLSRWIHTIRATKERQRDVINEHGIQLVNNDAAVIVRHDHTVRSDINLKEREQNMIMEIAKNPRNPDLYMDLGDLYMKSGEFSDAVESFSQALVFRPDDYIIKRKLERASMILEKIT